MFRKSPLAFVPRYSNNFDPYVPELWANESLMVLIENMVIGNLVHRDFDNQVARFGDTVNTRLPADFVAKRKIKTEDVTIQDASATNVPVVLNQHFHTSFLIEDEPETLSFKSLRDEFMVPAASSIARQIDKVLLGQVYQFLPSVGGYLGGLTPSNAVQYIVETRQTMNENKAPDFRRVCLFGTSAEAQLLQNSVFHEADKVGDDGTALREGSLGKKFGFNNFMAQNTCEVAVGNTIVTGAVNLSAGYAAGTTTMTVDGLSAAITNGTYFTVAGDMTPQRVVSTVGGATPTSITFSPGLKRAVANDAVITLYTPGAVNLVAGYAAGWHKEIVVDGFSVAPRVGQMIAFGTASPVYAVLEATTTSILLDRPLDLAIANDATVNIGPAGGYNFAFDRNALALVTRPLALSGNGRGAQMAIANFGGIGLRVTLAYNATKQALQVTIDVLMGTKVLNSSLGAVLLS